MKLQLAVLLAALAVLPVSGAEVPEGKPAPKVQMKLLKDGAVSDFPGWAAYKGKVVVLEFWSTDCAPCIAAMPRLAAVEKALAGKPIEYIFITPEKAERIIKFAKRQPIPGLTAVEGDSAWKAFGVSAVPQTVLIGKDGNVLRYTHPDELTEKSLSRLLETGSAGEISKSMFTRDEPPAPPAASQALFEVTVTSAPDDARMSYGSGHGNGAIKLNYKGLPLRQLLAKVYGVSASSVEIASAVPAGKFNFAARAPEAAEKEAVRLLKQAIMSAYGIEVRGVKAARQVLLLRSEKGAPHEGLTPAAGSGSRSEGSGMYRASGVPLALLAEVLGKNFGLPVLDETGLEGTFDIDLAWTPGDKDALSAALKERLGLTLSPASREIQILEVVTAGAETR